MSHGEVLPSNTEDPYFDSPAETPAEEAPPEARMATTPGEPGLSKVPSLTQSMLRDDSEAEPAP